MEDEHDAFAQALIERDAGALPAEEATRLEATLAGARQGLPLMNRWLGGAIDLVKTSDAFTEKHPKGGTVVGAEINQETDLEIELIEHRQGRVVDEVQFAVRRGGAVVHREHRQAQPLAQQTRDGATHGVRLPAGGHRQLPVRGALRAAQACRRLRGAAGMPHAQ